MMMSEHEKFETPADVAEIGAALDALAATERGSAPAGLERRLFERTRGLIGASDVRPLVMTKRRPLRVFTAMRMAAAVVICAGTAAIWMSQIGPHAPHAGLRASTLEDDVDLMLALRGQDPVGERIDVLFSDTAALKDSVNKPGDAIPEGDPL
jgi:hypothetical protein